MRSTGWTNSDSIRVGWPEGLAADPATLDFVAGFLAEQSTNWGLSEGTTNEIVQDDSAAAALQAGTIDVFISPVQIPGLDPIPLFEDPQGQQYWLYYDPADPAFGEAQREYVRTVVGDEAFRDLYTEELHAEPTYEGFSELFGLEQP